MKAPCLNCEKSGCGVHHDKCDMYGRYRTEREELSKERIERVRRLPLRKPLRRKIVRTN